VTARELIETAKRQPWRVRVETPIAFRSLFDPPLGSVRYRIFYGGRGSAKSWQIARALLVHGMRRPLRILCAREYQSSMRQSVYRVLVDMVKRLGFGGFYHSTKTGIVGKNGTEFIFAGLRRDIEQVKSTEGIDICWIEEAQSVSDDSWQTLIPTIRAPGSEIWASFNPAEATDATYQRFVLKPPKDGRAIVRKVTWRDNPWLPDVLRAEREELLETDPEAEAHVWEGEPWSRSESQVLSGKWRVQDFTPAKDWGEPLFGLDFGFSRDPSILVKLWRYDRRLWVEYEAGGVLLDNDEMARRMDEVPGVRAYPILADNARPETIAELKKRGFRVSGADKWEGSVRDGVAHLRSYAEIVIHPRCTIAQQQARLWRFKTDPRTGLILPRLRDGNDDAWDATRYALSRVIQRKGGGGGLVYFPGMDGGPVGDDLKDDRP
jgi:phage terminase large subunit